jgi:hypothetical protein
MPYKQAHLLGGRSAFFVAGTVQRTPAFILDTLAGAPSLHLGSHVIIEHDKQLLEFTDQLASSNPVSSNEIIVARVGLLSDSLGEGQDAVPACLIQAKMEQRSGLIGINKCRA